MIVVWEGQSHATFHKPSTVLHGVGEVELAELILRTVGCRICFQSHLAFGLTLKIFGFSDISSWLNASEERWSPPRRGTLNGGECSQQRSHRCSPAHE